MDSNIKELIELLKENKHNNDYISELVEFYQKGIPFNEWVNFANKQKQNLEGSSEIMLGILEDQWESIKYHDLDREEYYTLADSPLEILHYCIADDFLTYPPPEILWVIARQFRWYMENEGDVTLEEAFFGKPIKGKGVYSKRAADTKTKLYKAFHLKIKVNPDASQPQLLEKFCDTPAINLKPSKETCSQIYFENQKNEIDQDSFLRGYRRWKKDITDK